MSLVIKFYFISSMLNMFRTLIHPSSGACHFSIVSPHWLCVLVSMCVGVSVWLVGVVSVLQASACISHHHHHKYQGLDPLIRSVSRVTAACANASSVFQLFSFLVVCSGMISNGIGFVAFFASVKASSVCIHLSCLVCL